MQIINIYLIKCTKLYNEVLFWHSSTVLFKFMSAFFWARHALSWLSVSPAVENICSAAGVEDTWAHVCVYIYIYIYKYIYIYIYIYWPGQTRWRRSLSSPTTTQQDGGGLLCRGTYVVFNLLLCLLWSVELRCLVLWQACHKQIKSINRRWLAATEAKGNVK